MKRFVLTVAAAFVAAVAGAQGSTAATRRRGAAQDRRDQRRAPGSGIGARQGGLQPGQEAQRPEEGRGRQAPEGAPRHGAEARRPGVGPGRGQARRAPEVRTRRRRSPSSASRTTPTATSRPPQKKELAELERRVFPVINQVGKEKGFTLIFNKFQSGLVYAEDVGRHHRRGSEGVQHDRRRARGEARRRRRGAKAPAKPAPGAGADQEAVARGREPSRRGPLEAPDRGGRAGRGVPPLRRGRFHAGRGRRRRRRPRRAAIRGGRLTGRRARSTRRVPRDLSWVADERRAARGGRAAARGRFSCPDEALAGGKPCVVVAAPAARARGDGSRAFRPPTRPRAGVARGAFVAQVGDGSGRASRSPPGATVSAGARGRRAHGDRAPGAFVGEDAEVGEDCVLVPNAAVLAGCLVGDRCILQAGAVVGSDGFGYVWDGRRTARSRRSASCGSRTTSRSAPTPRSTARHSARRSSAAGPRSTTWCRSGTTCRSGEHSILCGQAGIGGSSTPGPGRDAGRTGRHLGPRPRSATARS